MHKKVLLLILFSQVIFQGGCMLKAKSSYDRFYTLGERGNETPHIYLKNDDPGSPFSGMDSEFTAYFPDIVPGKEPRTRKLLPKDIVNRFLSDQFQHENGEGETFYAVGKIMGYRGMNMLVCDYEDNRSDEDTYDNHVDAIRLLLLYHQDGTPVLTDNEVDGTIRKVFSLSNHYYGEGGEASTQSRFDRDTTLITHELHSESESATDYNAPLISEIEYRWRVNEQGGKELLEYRKVEFSSPFYDLSYLQKQEWDTVSDNESNGVFPTQERAWELTMPENMVFPMTVFFYIQRVNGVLTPIFESCDKTSEGGRILDRYRVGQPQVGGQTSSESSKQSDKLQCSVIIKTSDGILEVLPSGKFNVYQ